MNDNSNRPRPPRIDVLFVIRSEGAVDVYAEAHVNVLIAREPVAPSRAAEALADDALYLLLPRRYRALYRADRLCARGTSRRLTAGAAHAVLLIHDLLDALNALSADEDETWMS